MPLIQLVAIHKKRPLHYGRTESILLSMPPIVKWRYDWKPEAKSPENKLYTDFLIDKDWLSII